MRNTSAFWNETLQLALQALRANKVRAMLTMLGVIIGSACIVLVVTVALTGKRYIISEIEGVGSNLVLAEMINPGGAENLALSDQITPADLQAVKQDIPQVTEAAGTDDIRMNVTVGGAVHPISLVGVTEGFNTVRRLVAVRGRYFDQDDMASRSKVCLITEQLAASMFPYDNPLGKDIAIEELHFTVIGVFRERVATFGQTEITPETVIVPFSLIKDYTGTDYFKSFYAQADNSDDVPTVTQRVAEVLASRHRPGAKYHVWNLAGILAAAKNISMALTLLLIVVAMIALTISGIGIMNIMLVTVTERTREIGIRKAIGAPRAAILYQFLGEAVLISGTGALAGIAIGILIPVVANIVLTIPPIATFLSDFVPAGGDVSVPISWASVVLAFVVSCSTGLIFGYLPANRAARLSQRNLYAMNKLRRCANSLLVFAALSVVPARAQNTPSPEKLTLREAVMLALQNSRDLKLARVQYSVALGEARVDRATFLPNVYTGGGYVYTYGFPSVPGSGPPAVFQLDYTQSLFNPSLKGQQRAAEDRARSQKIELDRIRDGVMVRTASAYLELAEVRHLIELMSNDQASAEKILALTRERVAANQELAIEETRAELTSARIRERLIKLQDRNETLSQQLRDLTGVPDGQTIEVEPEETSFAVDLEESQVADLAVENDPAIKEAEDERSARQHLLKGARQSYWPTIDAVAQYSVFSKLNNYDLYYKTFQRNNFNAGIEITIPLFAAKTSANAALAKSQLNEAEVVLSNKREQVRLESSQESREIRELEATREVARLDLKLAQQTLELAQAKLEDGKATLKDVEQSRLEESDKWMEFLDANLAWQRAQLKVLQATGQLAKVLQ